MSSGAFQFTEVYPLQRVVWMRVPESFDPAKMSVSWSSVVGKPATMPPSTHYHDDRYCRIEDADQVYDYLQGLCDDGFNEMLQHHHFSN